MERFQSTIDCHLLTTSNVCEAVSSNGLLWRCLIKLDGCLIGFTSSFTSISRLFQWKQITIFWTPQFLRPFAYPTQSRGRLKPPRRFMYCLKQIGQVSTKKTSDVSEWQKRKNIDLPVLFSLNKIKSKRKL